MVAIFHLLNMGAGEADPVTTNDSTIGTTGRDHTTFTAWEAATDNDLAGTNVIERGSAYDDSNFSETVVFAGATVDSARFRIVQAASGEEFDPSDTSGVFNSDSSATEVFSIQEKYFRALHIGADNTEATAGAQRSTWAVRGTGESFALLRSCVGYNATGTVDSRIVNCAAIDIDGPASTGTGVFCSSAGSTGRVQNTLCFGSATNDFNLTGVDTESNNASEDATAAGTDSHASVTPGNEVVGPDGTNLRQLTGGNLYHGGVDLSGVLNPRTSFDANISHDAAWVSDWSIGPYEVEATLAARALITVDAIITTAKFGGTPGHFSFKARGFATGVVDFRGSPGQITCSATPASDDPVGATGIVREGRPLAVGYPGGQTVKARPTEAQTSSASGRNRQARHARVKEAQVLIGGSF
jgi:hypothetical protein